MMKTLLLSFITLMSALTFAQEVRLQVGKQFNYVYRSRTKGADIGNTENTYSFKVLEKNPKGGYKLECILEKAILEELAYKNTFMHLNTDSLRSTSLISTVLLKPLSILKKPFIVELSNLGLVERVHGIEEQVKSSVSDWQLSKNLEEQLLTNMLYYPTTELQSLFLALPKEKIGFNSSWEKADLRYKVVSIKGALLTIKVSQAARSSNSNKQIGEISYNTSSGLIESSVLNNDEPGENKEQEVAVRPSTYQKLLHFIPGSQPDTAWLNMAIRLSWMSDALKSKGEFDTSKINGAFKHYDEKFRYDPYYNSQKLSLMQSMRGEKSYLAYSRQLLKTPNHFLVGEFSHLHNKIGESLEISADSAMAVAKYLSKNSSFDHWIQHSFAQAFRDTSRGGPTEEEKKAIFKRLKNSGWTDEDIAESERNYKRKTSNSYNLVNMMADDAAMKQKVMPLFLWVNAKTNKDDKELLSKASAEFRKMSDADFISGNAGRYSLLIYELLASSSRETAAFALLNSTIKRLEKLYADSLNSERYAHQYLLSHAFYLHYRQAEKTDSVKALQYLSKAAGYSARNSKEKAHISFYDRVLLDAKENYRPEFFSKLFKLGDSEQAMKVIVSHINANPDQISEIQQTFEKHLPGKNFGHFLANDVQESWEQAPEFSLKTLDGEVRSLNDYKGKWLVLDFWGTWCGPCRDEMPALNKFNKELENGQSKKIAFLSIACRDSENKVKTFFTANNYSIPAVMSDNEVERKYKILGYPTKIIVSPTGKCLMIDFGKDWKTAVQNFSKWY